jgi:aspartyl-tRNA(Asn)/glutamyl-tRNA(Gln) amidotransferase subunit A
MAPVSLYALYGGSLASDGHKLDPSARLAIEGGKRITGEDLQRAQMERTRLFRLVQEKLTRFDLLATPTLAATARGTDHKAFDPLSIAGAKPAGPRFSWYPYAHAFNATGHPAISLPAGFGADGLPVGLQLVGPWAGEARLLRAAAALETLRPCRQHRPQLEASPLQTRALT